MVYSPEEFTASEKFSPDHAITVTDSSPRYDPQLKSRFNELLNTHHASYSPIQFTYGKSTLDKIFIPAILTRNQYRSIHAKSGLMRAGLILLQKRQIRILMILEQHDRSIADNLSSEQLHEWKIQPESTAYKFLKQSGHVIENWGQLDPQIASQFLAEISIAQDDLEDPAVKLALYYQEKPPVSKENREADLRVIASGLQKGFLVQLINPDLIANYQTQRCLQFSWKRRAPFNYFNAHNRLIRTARAKETVEYHRVTLNHCSYLKAHGMVISGRVYAHKDPSAHQPNTRYDIDKLLKMVEYFNPPPSSPLLRGEAPLFCFQNPRAMSSILMTEHCHIAEFHPPSLYLLKIKPQLTQSLNSDLQLNVIQLGSREDALVLDYVLAEPRSDHIDEISRLMLSMQCHFDKIDISTVAFIAEGRYHFLLIPMDRLTLDRANQLLYNSSGESDQSFGVKSYYCAPHPILGMFRLPFDNRTENELLAYGHRAISYFADFISVKGLKDHLVQFLEASKKYAGRVRQF